MTPRPAPQGLRAPRAAAAATAVLGVVGVLGLWSVFVTTFTGQRVDQAAFDGSSVGRSRLWTVAEPVLEIISVPFVAAVLLAAMLLAVLRRRLLVAAQVAVLMAGANLSTQLLKNVVLDRPVYGVDRWFLANTMPSGHTTAAASVAVALLLVVPPRLRPGAAVVAVAYTGATGVSTLVGRWHRPSDVVAALLVVLVWGAVAVALGLRHPGPGRVRVPGPGGRLAVVLAAAGVLLGIGAGLALQRTLAALPEGIEGRAELATAYAGGALGVAAATCLVFAVLLALLRQTDVVPAAPVRAVVPAHGVRGPAAVEVDGRS